MQLCSRKFNGISHLSQFKLKVLYLLVENHQVETMFGLHSYDLISKNELIVFGVSSKFLPSLNAFDQK